MKRLLAFSLLWVLLLTGCGLEREGSRLYYPRANYLHNDPEPVIGCEIRDTAGHTQDLRYLLTQYFMGPMDRSLRSPLPRGTRMTALENADGVIIITASEEADTLSDAKFSQAAACLGLTVMEALGEDAQVTLVCGDRSLTVTRDTLLLYEEPFPDATEES